MFATCYFPLTVRLSRKKSGTRYENGFFSSASIELLEIRIYKEHVTYTFEITKNKWLQIQTKDPNNRKLIMKYDIGISDSCKIKNERLYKSTRAEHTTTRTSKKNNK